MRFAFMFLLLIICCCSACSLSAHANDGPAYMVLDIFPGEHNSSPEYMMEINNTVYFRATEPSHGTELWKSDGTPQGTVMVKDVEPGKYGSAAMNFGRLGNILLFHDWDRMDVPWRSDGTDAGTFPLASGRGADDFTAVGQWAFFGYENADLSSSQYGDELWKTDGTAANTQMVKDINPRTPVDRSTGYGCSYPSHLTNVNGTLYFEANDGTHGKELWRSDGTETGTFMVKDINPGTSSSAGAVYPPCGVELSDRLIFIANDGVHGLELWKSDGTEAGTAMVKDMNPGPGNGFVYRTGQLTKVGDKVYFTASDGTHGAEMWVTDGTGQGTFMLKDINPGPGNGYGFNLVVLGNILCFTAFAPDLGYELWRTDGTEGGTQLVKDIWPGPESGWPTVTVSAHGRIYSCASDGVYGTEVWTSDGTEQGTYRLTDINPGAENSFPMDFAATDKLLFFRADDGVHGEELWALPLPAASAKKSWALY